MESYADVLTCNTKQYAKYFSQLLKSGIYVAPSPFEAVFLSSSHSAEDIEYTAKIIKGLDI